MSFDFFHQCNNYPWFNNWPINVVWQYKIWCPIWLLLLDATLHCATFLFSLFMILIDHVNYTIMHKWTFPKTFIKIGRYNELVLNLHRHNLLVLAKKILVIQFCRWFDNFCGWSTYQMVCFFNIGMLLHMRSTKQSLEVKNLKKNLFNKTKIENKNMLKKYSPR